MASAVITLAAAAAPAPGLNLALQPKQPNQTALQYKQPDDLGCGYVLFDTTEKASKAEKECAKLGYTMVGSPHSAEPTGPPKMPRRATPLAGTSSVSIR